MSQLPLLQRTLRHFRSRRMRLFEQTFEISNSTRILDVGGSRSIWQLASVEPRLTILNLPTALDLGVDLIDQVAGDGCHLPFRDKAFDIVFSNSVIEHVGSPSAQREFANEIARVGRHYWVQTPNRRFPVELHLMLPFIHYLPKSFAQFIVNRFTVWELLARPTSEQRAFYIRHVLEDVKLLDARELRVLFPGARIVKERFLGLAKSLIACS